jgi:hypothetical protein
MHLGGELSRTGRSSSKNVVDLPLGEDVPPQRGELLAKTATSLQAKKILHGDARNAPAGEISPLRIRRLTDYGAKISRRKRTRRCRGEDSTAEEESPPKEGSLHAGRRLAAEKTKIPPQKRTRPRKDENFTPEED